MKNSLLMDWLTPYLEQYREERGFDVDIYIQKKVKAINDFFREQNLQGAVIGISGGIDSAVTFYLLDKARNEPDSPINQIIPISMPIREAKGVTGQEESANLAEIVIESLDYSYHEIDLTDAYHSIADQGFDIDPEQRAWAEGQMASVLRTPVLYYHAALSQACGSKTIVVGTTNRDEGSYIGFFGKASDAMVDLQPIADIHKSEVYRVAKELGVPWEIINREPKGDVWDNKNDQDMIGASYDDLELFLHITNDTSHKKLILDELFLTYIPFQNIEKLHQINKHKYAVGNPAHFIDVMERKVKGGW